MGAVPIPETAEAALPAGQVEMGDKIYMPRADGAMVPLELVKAKHRLQDDLVRDLLVEAEVIAFTLSQFKARALERLDALQAILAQEHKSKLGGEKGNASVFSYDGLQRVQRQVADLIKFGPELQVAKTLLDECTSEWLEGSRVELRAIVMNAFRVNKEGQLNRSAILGLRSYDIEDERWKRAMDAISESIKVIGSKSYVRFARRATLDDAWEEISLSLATAKLPLEMVKTGIQPSFEEGAEGR